MTDWRGLALSLLLTAGIAQADAPAPLLQFTVVAKAESVHRTRSKLNIYPWEREEPGTVLGTAPDDSVRAHLDELEIK